MRVQFVGSGDAFGSGGRFQACLSVRTTESHVLLDCGATSMTALRRLGIEPQDLDAVVVSHLHGDHFGGIPFLVLDAQFSHRAEPLLLAGPPGLEARMWQAMEVLFPGSSSVQRRFPIHFLELPERTACRVLDLSVTAYAVPHPSGAPAYAIRLDAEGKSLAYSGDGAWSDALIEVSRGADLFICEAYSRNKAIPHHLTYEALQQQRQRLTCRRLILVHMSGDMLQAAHVVPEQTAEDGLTLTL